MIRERRYDHDFVCFHNDKFYRTHLETFVKSLPPAFELNKDITVDAESSYLSDESPVTICKNMASWTPNSTVDEQRYKALTSGIFHLQSTKNRAVRFTYV